MEKIVYQIGARGEFVSETVADESPLEPGVFLIPAGCVEDVPPPHMEGKERVYSGGAWEYQDQPAQPDQTAEQIIAARVAAVQAHMDAAARALNYDDIKTAVTYADEPAVPKFQADGQAFRAWRSLVWAACCAILAEVEAGTRPIPSDTELIAELPALELPQA